MVCTTARPPKLITRKRGLLFPRQDSNPHAAHLETHGWTLVQQAFSNQEVSTIKAEVLRVFEEYPADQRGPDPQAWPMFRYEMLNRSAACQQAVAHRAILDVIEPLLGDDCHIIANTAWQNPPGSDGLHAGGRWHIDAGPHIPLEEGVEWPENIPHPVFAIGVHLYLEPCGLADGPTGVLPGSHLSGRPPPPEKALDDTLTYNGQRVQPLIAQAGDIGLFVSDVWHRRMPTQAGDKGRLFLQLHYGRRDIAQRLKPTSEVNHLSSAALSLAQEDREKTVIGLHPRFFYDG